MAAIEIKNLDKKAGVKKKKPVNERLPNIPFSWILVGPSGTGKSNLLLNILELYKKHFKKQHIILFSPSLGLDPKTSEIQAGWRYAEFHPSIIESVIEQQKKIIHEKPTKVPDILIIMDDCISEPGAFNQKGILEKLFYRCRHFHCSLLITSQKYSSLSRGMRLNSKTVSFFKPYNESERDHILKEHSDKHSKDGMSMMLDSVWVKPFHFAHFDYTKNGFNRKYQCCLHDYMDLKEFKKSSKKIEKDIQDDEHTRP